MPKSFITSAFADFSRNFKPGPAEISATLDLRRRICYLMEDGPDRRDRNRIRLPCSAVASAGQLRHLAGQGEELSVSQSAGRNDRSSLSRLRRAARATAVFFSTAAGFISTWGTSNMPRPSACNLRDIVTYDLAGDELLQTALVELGATRSRLASSRTTSIITPARPLVATRII